MNVSPGDKMSASVQETSPGVWAISISNLSKAQSLQTDTNQLISLNLLPANFGPIDKTSAEAIVERGAFFFNQALLLTPLADFGQITFTQASAGSTMQEANPFNGATASAVIMADVPFGNGFTLADPGPLGSDGAFSVNWFNSGHPMPFNIRVRRLFLLD
jgi:hypothetical protein